MCLVSFGFFYCIDLCFWCVPSGDLVESQSHKTHSMQQGPLARIIPGKTLMEQFCCGKIPYSSLPQWMLSYPEKKLYYSGGFVSIEFTCVFILLFPLWPHLSLSEQGGGKRRWWKKLLYVFNVLGTDGIACCNCQWFWQDFGTCSFPLWNCSLTWLHV